jgi:hypothetical protein
MQILQALAKALMFFGAQATVLISVILAVRWHARRKARLEHEGGPQSDKRP